MTRVMKFDVMLKERLGLEQIQHNVVTLEDIEECEPDYYEYEVVARREWTGLRDATGQDVFEGDVVTGRSWTFMVVWDEHAARFKLENVRADRNQHIAMGNVHTCRVIGNIFENPELLNQAA